MMHTRPGFKTKKALREAIAAGQEVCLIENTVMTGFRDRYVQDGKGVIEEPPEFHRWYATVRAEGGRIVEVVS